MVLLFIFFFYMYKPDVFIGSVSCPTVTFISIDCYLFINIS